MADESRFKIGDVISMKRMNPDVPSMPKELEDKYWRVKSVDSRGLLTLDGPYADEQLTKRYRPVYPPPVQR